MPWDTRAGDSLLRSWVRHADETVAHLQCAPRSCVRVRGEKPGRYGYDLVLSPQSAPTYATPAQKHVLNDNTNAVGKVLASKVAPYWVFQ